MKNFHDNVNIGIREKGSGKLIAVYPHKVSGDTSEVEEKVKFWFYQQSCIAEDILRESYVDIVPENELKERHDIL